MRCQGNNLIKKIMKGFQKHIAQSLSIIHSPRSCEHNGHHHFTSDIDELLPQNCYSFNSMSLCKNHMMILELWSWVNILGKA